MYPYICIHMYPYICGYICFHTYVLRYIRMHTIRAHAHIYTCTICIWIIRCWVSFWSVCLSSLFLSLTHTHHVYIHAHMHAYKYTHTQIYIHIYIYIYIYIYIDIHTHTHTHIHPGTYSAHTRRTHIYAPLLYTQNSHLRTLALGLKPVAHKIYTYKYTYINTYTELQDPRRCCSWPQARCTHGWPHQSGRALWIYVWRCFRSRQGSCQTSGK